MDTAIDRVKSIRVYLIELLKDVSVEQLNEIPAGFNNNIIWNLGHLTAAQQGICYVRAGIPPAVPEQYLSPYKPGTKPEKFIDAGEVAIIKEILLSSLGQFKTDLKNDSFKNYTAWTSRYGVALATIEDAVSFLLFHEGLHSGYIMALKRLLKK